jgi:hypothetical protein
MFEANSNKRSLILLGPYGEFSSNEFSPFLHAQDSQMESRPICLSGRVIETFSIISYLSNNLMCHPRDIDPNLSPMRMPCGIGQTFLYNPVKSKLLVTVEFERQ